MLVHFQRKNVINAAAFIIIVSTIIIYAESGGIVGKTQKNGIGCTCHSETPSVNVLVAIAGPDTIVAGQSATYTVTIQGGPLIAGGTNIAASDGDLFPIAGDLRKENFELTHVQPKLSSGGMVTFQFTYTAPSIVGQQTLFANGNSVNFNGANSGDSWNFASNKVISVVQPTGVNDQISVNSFELRQNYPNPFNPSTTISWQSAVGSQQTLNIFDVLGNEVASLINEWKEVGNHSVDLNASGLASGIYYYKLSAGNFTSTKKMILLR
ncbi:MAG: hypothetical protein A2W11_14000 [Ignavibacteria bacterium RBG_16_35_7]|nr:MAG: hypothetical protein A2W11_14000 [Ignavibacteria bacterium RBG_16_35_7]